MSVDHDSDRFAYEDGRADPVTRSEADECVTHIDDICNEVREFARAKANLIAMLYPHCIDLIDWCKGAAPLQVDEAIEGVVERVDEAFANLLDGSEIERLRNVAKDGYDD